MMRWYIAMSASYFLVRAVALLATYDSVTTQDHPILVLIRWILLVVSTAVGLYLLV